MAVTATVTDLDDIGPANARRSFDASEAVRFSPAEPLKLDGGGALAPLTIAYKTYGHLRPAKDNAILVCHALTGDQHVASDHPVTGKPGWWTRMVGPGKPIDTDRFFIICVNVVGGCMGSTGPGFLNPATARPYAMEFPVITVGDMVRAQKMLLDHLGIAQLLCVVGGSMGGMQVLQWTSAYPESVFSAIPIATAARHTSQNIAFHEVGRQAIMADPNWQNGNYSNGRTPEKGLAVARMAAHITYLSDAALHQKFGRTLSNRSALTFGFDADFQIESYLRHQGISFVDRFDANSYLYITRAMDYFDLEAEAGGTLANAFKNTRSRICLVSFTSDWLFPTSEARKLVHALNAVAANVSFVEIASDKGHDAFLLDEPELNATVSGFLEFGRARTRDCMKADATRPQLRPDFALIATLVPPNSRVLDVGCGDGALLELLARDRQVDGRGIELSQAGVNACVAHGLSVIQGDADTDLALYPDGAFDFVILSQTIQATRRPGEVLTQMLRIGRRAIVSFPNFAHWRVRFDLVLKGRMPETGALPHRWHETPNIHLCSVADFENLTGSLGLTIEHAYKLTGGTHGHIREIRPASAWSNLTAEAALYLLAAGATRGK